VATVEGITKIRTGKLLNLSEQQLMDCDTQENGCEGGSHVKALKWIYSNGGITTVDDYPYKAQKGKCDPSKLGNHAATISGYRRVAMRSEKRLKNVVAMQPVSVAIDSNSKNFHHYKSGVYNGPCGTELSHVVTVVGYGKEGRSEYWVIKNSWGSSWGEQGFGRIKRNTAGKPEGMCGIAMYPAYPLKD
jgi:C1A family cysteine protease